MACFTLRGPAGDRVIEEGQPYRLALGERILPDSINWGCGPQINGDPNYDVEQELKAHGLKLGDSISWVTKKLGIKQCAPCKARQEILNHVEKVGWVETIKQIKGTFKGAV